MLNHELKTAVEPQLALPAVELTLEALSSPLRPANTGLKNPNFLR